MNNGDCCLNCRFWQRSKAFAEWGLCRRYAPSNNPNMLIDIRDFLLRAVIAFEEANGLAADRETVEKLLKGSNESPWGDTAPNEWCGDYEARPEHMRWEERVRELFEQWLHEASDKSGIPAEEIQRLLSAGEAQLEVRFLGIPGGSPK